MRALDSIKRASEYRDAGLLLYEPRFFEAEKAADDAYRETGTSDQDMQASMIPVTCISDLRVYRISLDTVSAEQRAVAERLKGFTAATLQKSLDDVDLAGHTIDGCIKDLESYF